MSSGTKAEGRGGESHGRAALTHDEDILSSIFTRVESRAARIALSEVIPRVLGDFDASLKDHLNLGTRPPG